MTGYRIVLAGMAAVLASCATSSQQTPAGTTPASTARDTSARGTIHVVGAAPRMAVVLAAEDGRITLAGPLTDELATLDGATVVVHGPVGASPVPAGGRHRAVTVRSYEIEAIAGGKPVVGILIADDAGARIDSIPLATLPPALGQFVGSKVWVVGTRTDAGAIRVESFGVLRRNPGSGDTSIDSLPAATPAA